jgi:hypothetical protein
MCDTIELAQHVTLWINTNEMQGQFEFVLPSPTPVWSTPLGFPMWRMHAPTFNKWYKKNMNKNKEGDTPHVDTWRNGRVWVDFLGGLY